MKFEKEIPQIRLCAQQLNAPAFRDAAELVNYMGALQSQDLPMSKWAVGIRTIGCTEEAVNAALNEGSILRTHVLRPTWHLVAAQNIRWMLDLTAPAILRIAKSYNKLVGITDKELSKTLRLFERWFNEHNELSRIELADMLRQSKIELGENRLSHFLFHAELNALICSGTIHGNAQHYALLDKRVPTQKYKMTRDEGLGRLALLYFRSHGPATVPDFSWWSGLTGTESAKALAIVEKALSRHAVDETIYFFDEVNRHDRHVSYVQLLPAFDELIIGYKDRSSIIPTGMTDRLITRNGIFYPSVIDRGVASGSWKRSVSSKSATLSLQLFSTRTTTTTNRITKAANHYGRFLNRPVIVKFQ